MSFVACRGGRGDRTGRYGNTHNDHNFRDMDYRAYGQEDEDAGVGYDVGAEGDMYGHEEQSLGVPDFLPGRLQDRLGFHQGGNGRGGKGLLWPPCTQSQADSAPPLLRREEEGSRRELEQLLTGRQERGRGKGGRGFPENSTPHSAGREGSWGRGGAHSEQMEYNTERPREEDRFSRAAVKRRVSHYKFILAKQRLQFHLVVDHACRFHAGLSSGGRGEKRCLGPLP